MTTPRRYVRVKRVETGQWLTTCASCGPTYASLEHSGAVAFADRHAGVCRHVVGAMERDRAGHEAHQLGVELSHLRAENTRLRDDRDRLRDRLMDAISALSEALEERHDT